MKFDINDLLNVSCFCDTYRKMMPATKSKKDEETLAQSVVAESQTKLAEDKSNDSAMER